MFHKRLSPENKQSGQCMAQLEYWENKQPRTSFPLDFAALLGMRAAETLLAFPGQKISFKIQLFIWHFCATLFLKNHINNGWRRGPPSNKPGHPPGSLSSADSESGPGHGWPPYPWSLCHAHDFPRTQRWGKNKKHFPLSSGSSLPSPLNLILALRDFLFSPASFLPLSFYFGKSMARDLCFSLPGCSLRKHQEAVETRVGTWWNWASPCCSGGSYSSNTLVLGNPFFWSILGCCDRYSHTDSGKATRRNPQ